MMRKFLAAVAWLEDSWWGDAIGAAMLFALLKLIMLLSLGFGGME